MVWIKGEIGRQKLLHEFRSSISGCHEVDSARLETLLNPRPPDFTGSVASSHGESSNLKLILVILDTIDMHQKIVPGYQKG